MSNAPRFTLKQLEAIRKANPHISFTGQMQSGPEKNNKYNAQKETVDGFTFDSRREAKRYIELRSLNWSNIITELRLQVPYELNPGGTYSLKYIADFVYKRDGQEIVEDSKGARTAAYKKKKRLMKEVHGIEIQEV